SASLARRRDRAARARIRAERRPRGRGHRGASLGARARSCAVSARDPGDVLEIFGLVEDPARWEATVRREIDAARSDPSARVMLESIYCDEDRGAAFERYRASRGFACIVRLLETLGLSRSARICEIGGGPGWLTWALRDAGFDMELVEPNGEWITG